MFCCAGGASRGYQLAGFRVVGIDISPQPRYIGDHFYQGDALTIADHLIRELQPDLVHASPPCQRFTNAQKIRNNDHPDLVAPTRDLLRSHGVPYVIENVVGAPLIDPVTLCGCMFADLSVYRERLFETSFPLAQPPHRLHDQRLTKMGRPPKTGERMHVVGNFSGVKQARLAMGIDWMARDELREAIPPTYTEHIARSYLADAACSFSRAASSSGSQPPVLPTR